MKKITFFSLTFSLFGLVTSQVHPCGFDEVLDAMQGKTAEFNRQQNAYLKYYKARVNPQFAPAAPGLVQHTNCEKATIVIPIAIHVVHQGGPENVSAAQIEQAIDEINEDFTSKGSSVPAAVNTGIKFVLASISRHNSNLTNHAKITQSESLMSLGFLGADTVVNIWLVKDITSAGVSGVQGYATYPGSSFNGKQGIVLRYDVFGNYARFGSPLATYSLGDFPSHEMGHYLGLYHPFEDSCVGLNSYDCSEMGDKCCDVPAVAYDYQTCSQNFNTCIENYNGNLPDQKENYMDYSNPLCKNTFTKDQAVLMYAMLDMKRPNLGSPIYMPSAAITKCIVTAKMAGDQAACSGQGIKLVAYNVQGNTYYWQLTRAGITLNSSAAGHTYTVTPSDTGHYKVLLTVSNGSQSITDTLPVYIYDCSIKLPSPKANWAFAEQAGISFTPNGVIPDVAIKRNEKPTQINASEGTACISDSSGNLLFYAGDRVGEDSTKNKPIGIFGKNYREIQLSPADEFNVSSTQGLLFLPYPDSANHYLLFYTKYDDTSIRYHVINQNDSNVSIPNSKKYGKISGTSLLLNVPNSVLSNPGFHHIISAVPQCNPKNFWLLVHDAPTGKIVVFSIAHDSIKYHSEFLSGITGEDHLLKFNAQGTHLSFGFNIYTFDRATAAIGFYKNLNLPNVTYIWGSEWSPNGKVLYRSEEYTTTYSEYKIRQYNIESSKNDLEQAEVALSNSDRVMQLGPDGKIYLAVNGDYLSVIHKPNELILNNANECEYEHVGVPLRFGSSGGKGNASSLPNLINAEVEPKKAGSFFAKVSNCLQVNVEPEIRCAASYKWIWGDGNTSNTKTASHTYTNTGSKTIKLVTNGTDTTTRTIFIGIPAQEKIITGNAFICDSTKVYTYSVLQNNNNSYNWLAINSMGLSNYKNTCDAQWKGNGSLKVYIQNSQGCNDSASKGVVVQNPIRNNTIDSNQAICNINQILNLTGTTPTGGVGSYTYKWNVRPLNGVWRTLPGTTLNAATSIKNDTSFQYARIITSGACSYESNIVQIINLNDLAKISLSKRACDNLLSSANELPSNLSFTYQWQQSTDGINFTNITGATNSNITTPYLIVETSPVSGSGYPAPTKKYYRKKIIGTNCTLYSNVIEVLPEVYLKGSSPQIPYCATSFKVSYDVVNNGYYPLKYKWYLENSSSVISTEITDNPELIINPKNLGLNGKITLEIYNPICGVNHKLKDEHVRNFNYSYFLYTSNFPEIVVKKEIGETAILPSNFRPSDIVQYLGWNMSTDNGATWTGGIGLVDTLNFGALSLLDDNTLLRPSAFVRCKPPVNLDTTTSGYQYGVTYRIRVNNPNGQYWIKDSHRDTGRERNTFDETNYTHSFDIWPRQRSNYGTRVINYMDQSGLKADEDTNFMHVMVRNYGNNVASGGKLYLYWTVNSTNEGWPNKWMGVSYNDTWYNADSGKYYPRSGRINKVGYPIGNIAPGDSLMVTVPWTQADTVPQPAWYYMTKGGQRLYSNTIGVCYLARIETSDVYPHEMGTPERRFTDKTIKENVLNNRKIASNNFILDYLRPPFSNQVGGWTFFYVNPKNGQLPRNTKFRMGVSDGAYYNTSEVVLQFSDKIWNKLVAANFPGQGFTIDLPNKALVIYQNNAEIGNFMMEPNITEPIGYTFRQKPGGNSGPNMQPYLFSFSQFLEDSIHVGSVQYGLYGPSGDPLDEGGPSKPSLGNKEISTASIETSLKAMPNPFKGEFDVKYKGGTFGKVRLVLYSMDGKIVSTLCDCNTDAEGSASAHFKADNLAAGNYLLKAFENGIEKQVLLIKMN